MACRVAHADGRAAAVHDERDAVFHAQVVEQALQMLDVVFDAVVDLRKGSPTYGKSFGVVLSAENRKQLFIPKGFAHGFLVLSEYAEFFYKVSDFYHPNDEGGLLWNDPDTAIDWPVKDESQLNIIERDRNWPKLCELE